MDISGKGKIMSDEEIAEKLVSEIYKEPRLQVLATTYINAPKNAEFRTKTYLIEGLEAFIDRERRAENDLSIRNKYEGINNGDGKGLVATDGGGGNPAPAAVDPFTRPGNDPWPKGGSKGGQGSGWKGGAGKGKGRGFTDEDEANMRKPIEGGPNNGKHRCTFYPLKNSCVRTDCSFAHVDDLTAGEKEALWFITMQRRERSDKINAPCYDNVKGRCHRGAACRFTHDPVA